MQDLLTHADSEPDQWFVSLLIGVIRTKSASFFLLANKNLCSSVTNLYRLCLMGWIFGLVKLIWFAGNGAKKDRRDHDQCMYSVSTFFRLQFWIINCKVPRCSLPLKMTSTPKRILDQMHCLVWGIPLDPFLISIGSKWLLPLDSYYIIRFRDRKDSCLSYGWYWHNWRLLLGLSARNLIQLPFITDLWNHYDVSGFL